MDGLQGQLAATIEADDGDAGPDAATRDQSFDPAPALKLIERELTQSHSVAFRAAHETRRSSEDQIEDAKRMSELAGSVGSVAASVARQAKEMAAAVEEIRNSADAISGHVARANAMTASATDKTARAESAVVELGRVAEEIAGVIELVSYIAQQTTMLSHNANIQAARAGEAGRGFAVIAQEVRKLSEDTRAATETVQKQMSALKRASQSCRESVSLVAGEVRNTAQLCASIDDAARSQLAGAAQLSTSAAESAGAAGELSEQGRALKDIAAQSLNSAGLIARQSVASDDALGKLHDNLFILMSQTRAHDAGDIEARQPILLRCRLKFDERIYPGETIEFSVDGATLRIPGADQSLEGARGACMIDGVGLLSAHVLRVDKIGAHVHFDRPPQAVMEAARRAVRQANDANAPLIARAVDGAFAISQAMEDALASRQLTEAQLFDQAYRPIRGTDPQQFSTMALPVLEKILTPIQEEIAASDKSMAFAASVDLNGYLPVHNLRYSHPQKANDPTWNTANCRNRRIFGDRAGLAAARNTKPHLVQFYARDMGGGKFVMMKEIDAPIVVNGRHWGGFRTSYTI